MLPNPIRTLFNFFNQIFSKQNFFLNSLNQNFFSFFNQNFFQSNLGLKKVIFLKKFQKSPPLLLFNLYQGTQPAST
jgi:hypothetical protein